MPSWIAAADVERAISALLSLASQALPEIQPTEGAEFTRGHACERPMLAFGSNQQFVPVDNYLRASGEWVNTQRG